MEEEDAAAAYKDFVEAMDGPSNSKKPAGFIGAGGSAYAPSRNLPGIPAQPRAMRTSASNPSMGQPARLGAFHEEEEEQQTASGICRNS